MGKLDEFMAAAPAQLTGSSTWASKYAGEMRRVFHEHAARAPRSLQAHLGPSELGAVCDRQVAGKMARLPVTNHVADPWPSIRGIALHAWAAEAFLGDNERSGQLRWAVEQRVTPHPNHPGTADLYDALEEAVVDHKFLGESSMAKVRSAEGPPRHYVVQLLLYGWGYRLLGLPVRRVALAAYPATGSSLDGTYVWEREHTAADGELLDEVFEQTEYRRKWAVALLTGAASLMDVPATSSDGECYFCLAGETEVVTHQGVRKIRDLAGAEAELLVPSHTAHTARGVFRSVPVRALGEQRLYAVNLRRYRATKTVYATAEHRWILGSGEVRDSTQLRAGDGLASVRAISSSHSARLISTGIAQGFTYGDGTRGQGQRPGSLVIYKRSEKSVVLDHFGPIETSTYPTPDGDSATHLYGLPRYWKQTPPTAESRPFLLSWLAGYFAADGTVSKSGQCSISSADQASLEFVRDIASVCGIGHGLIKSKMRLGTGTTPTALYTIDLDLRGLPAWFWLLPHHIERIAPRRATAPRITNWSVESVKQTNRVETVYCATVPGVGAFGLADGLTTGNCPHFRPQAAKDHGAGCPGHVGNPNVDQQMRN